MSPTLFIIITIITIIAVIAAGLAYRDRHVRVKALTEEIRSRNETIRRFGHVQAGLERDNNDLRQRLQDQGQKAARRIRKSEGR